jgi:hypothetical protein
MNRMQTAGLGLVIVACCTVDGTNDDPFGAGTVPAPTTTITTTIDPSTSDGSSSTSGGDETTTTTTAATTMPASDSSGPDPVGTSDGGSTDGGGDDGMQPQDGMYSPCLTPQECGMTPILCITILDAMMNPSDGFCSETGCANPAVDCAASPGGTAIPRCMPVTVNQMALQACALDCSGGKVCPAPMQCYDLDGVGMVCG